jgi:SulP family sulfate permease
MMAVIGLVNFQAIRHSWLANKHDGAAAVVTFVATLAFAPHLDQGIVMGAGLAIMLFLYRTMRPRVAILVRHADGTLRDARVFPNLPRCEAVIALRFDGRLYFANVPFFEDAMLEAVAAQPNAKYLLVVGDAINEIDASGEEVIYHLVRRFKDVGVTVGFSGLKKQVLDVLRATHLIDLIGDDNIFSDEERAFEHIAQTLGDEAVVNLVRTRVPSADVLKGSTT